MGLQSLEGGLRRWSAAHGIEALRIALGLAFLWLGALKLLDRSPVEDLLTGIVDWAPADLVVLAFGAAEVTIGLALLFGFAGGLALLLLWALLAGGLATLALEPALVFSPANPLLVTFTGEFILTHLLLVLAALALVSTRR